MTPDPATPDLQKAAELVAYDVSEKKKRAEAIIEGALRELADSLPSYFDVGSVYASVGRAEVIAESGRRIVSTPCPKCRIELTASFCTP